MDEYITRNNAISAVCLGCNQQFSDEPCEPSDCTIRRSIMALPTADVAPRAEVDAKIATATQEKAREIFAELDKEYGENCGAYSIDDVTFGEIRSFLAKLKKKYTEGRNENIQKSICVKRELFHKDRQGLFL